MYNILWNDILSHINPSSSVSICSHLSICSSILEDCKFAPDRIDAFKTLYIENKPQLRANLGRVRSSLPHIVDVDWRLDYYIKSNQMERVDKPVYLIGLKTEKSDEVQTKEIQFACTQEQLQDLVSKLKDASKCLEKFSQ